MKNILRLFACLLLMPLPQAGTSQAFDWINPELYQQWTAKWISHPDDPGREFGVYHFKKEFRLDKSPQTFVVHVSADNRYKLYVNGQYITFGPARGDRLNWRYETLDLAPYLRPGDNLVAATVWNFAGYRPVAQHSVKTGFILQGNTEAERVADTNGSWKVFKDDAYTPLTTNLNAYYVVGPGEEFNAYAHLWNWMQPGAYETRFVAAREGETGRPPMSLERHGGIADHVLVPRTIPLMEERPQRFKAIRRQEGPRVDDAFVAGQAPVEVPANTSLTLLLDQGHLTNAYPELSYSGGAGGLIRITYAESLFAEDGQKYNRDEVEGKTIKGGSDLIHPDGGNDRSFETLWWRTFRYVQLDVQTGGQPLVLQDFRSRFTGYPLKEKASFQTDRQELSPIWEVGWRTQRLCAGENYFDCPYYEQLQYAGDTRIQCLISTYVSGDTRLFKNALLSYRDSKLPFGLTQSRYPSYDPQLIPPFSLVWITMLHDYWMLTPDPETVRALVPEMLSVLEWYERHLDDTGLLGKMEWWNFVDWVEAEGWQSGVPPGVRDGHSALLSLQYLYTLQKAVGLLEHFGFEGQARRYRERSVALQEAVRTQCWDAGRGLYADTPEKRLFSQHTNALAVLTGTAPAEEQAGLMRRVLEGQGMAHTTYYFSFYRTEAMQQAGLSNQYLETLGPWQTMLNQGLTTFAEEPDPTRSDCHAWSASPLYHFLSLVCGVKPGAPGFSKVRIAPHLNGLQTVNASIPHPLGTIEVLWEAVGDTGLKGQVVLPEGVDGSLEWGGHSYPLQAGVNPIRITP